MGHESALVVLQKSHCATNQVIKWHLLINSSHSSFTFENSKKTGLACATRNARKLTERPISDYSSGLLEVEHIYTLPAENKYLQATLSIEVSQKRETKTETCFHTADEEAVALTCMKINIVFALDKPDKSQAQRAAAWNRASLSVRTMVLSCLITVFHPRRISLVQLDFMVSELTSRHHERRQSHPFSAS